MYNRHHKTCCVSDGHLADTPVDSVYLGVVLLWGFQMLLFLLELNNLPTWATSIGNAYLKAYTTEKLVICAGPKFCDQAGNLLVINKALYGLGTLGQRFNELIC